MKSYGQFFPELKRRQLFKVTAVYGAVGFVVQRERFLREIATS